MHHFLQAFTVNSVPHTVSDFGYVNLLIRSPVHMVIQLSVNHLTFIIIHVICITSILAKCGAEWHVSEKLPAPDVSHAKGQVIACRETLLKGAGHSSLSLGQTQVLPVGQATLFVCACTHTHTHTHIK